VSSQTLAESKLVEKGAQIRNNFMSFVYRETLAVHTQNVN